MNYLDLNTLADEKRQLENSASVECKTCGEDLKPAKDDDGWRTDVWVTLEGDAHCAQSEDGKHAPDGDGLDDTDQERLEALQALEIDLGSDLKDYARNESTLVPESEFQDYAEELADDIGMVDKDSAIYHYVNWEKWADALKMDYTEVQFDGETYLIRSY